VAKGKNNHPGEERNSLFKFQGAKYPCILGVAKKLLQKDKGSQGRKKKSDSSSCGS